MIEHDGRSGCRTGRRRPHRPSTVRSRTYVLLYCKVMGGGCITTRERKLHGGCALWRCRQDATERGEACASLSTLNTATCSNKSFRHDTFFHPDSGTVHAARTVSTLSMCSNKCIVFGMEQRNTDGRAERSHMTCDLEQHKSFRAAHALHTLRPHHTCKILRAKRVTTYRMCTLVPPCTVVHLVNTQAERLRYCIVSLCVPRS